MIGPVYFSRLFQHMEWADTLCLDALEQIPNAPERAHLIMSHSLVCGVLWYNRIIGKDCPYKIWETLPLAKLREISRENTADWLRLFESLRDDELDRRLAYKTTSGVPYKTTLRDIFAHVANHATHHRGQVVNILREAGHTPPATDYVFYIREIEKDNPDAN